MYVKLAILTGLSMMLIGPIASGQDEGADAKEESERICLNVRSIRSFDALTDKFVYVKEGSSKHYLFTMRNQCFGLRNSMGIAIKDATSRVCSDGFGEILYRDRMGGRRLESCRIAEIERVENKDEARAIVDARVEMNSNDH